MKAMILAAGFGTRLLPYTQHTPKPLFTLSGKPVLEHAIERLQNAGCKEIVINTHHLHRKIEIYIASKKYPIPVYLLHEPAILGTGGAIKHAANFLDAAPFILFNSDIVTDIDLGKVYAFHLKHRHPVTMVMHDYAQYNNVSIDSDNCITKFHSGTADSRLAFTGIHVIDPEILDLIPGGQFYSIIDVYKMVVSSGRCVKAFIVQDHYWRDIGTPESYKQAVFDTMAPQAFQLAFSDFKKNGISPARIEGDGSDRLWYRVSSDNRTLIAVDHGIRQSEETAEVDAFVNIGNHLYKKNLPVPEIYVHDTFSGLVFLEDLGNTHLQDIILKSESEEEITAHYQNIIQLIGDFSIKAIKDFDTSWTYQTPRYDKDLILEKECRYFVEAFLRNYLEMDVQFGDLQEEFNRLADNVLAHAAPGLMHRDMQSRNIMVKDKAYYFIDFQGARLGPVQYDLASLIIDPYVALPLNLQTQLVDVSVEILSSKTGVQKESFKQCLNYCFMTRNFQMLGAFGFLSKTKGKKYFEQYIPAAVKTLKHYTNEGLTDGMPNLKKTINEI